MEEAEGSSYDNTHRAFLQSLLARPALSYEDAKPILAAIQTAATPDRPTLTEDVTQEDFDNYINTLNNQLSPFDLEVRSTLDQRTRVRVYALVNMTSDALTQMATMHTVDELAFIKRTLDAMFETYNTPRAEIMAITATQALKLAKGDGTRRESGTQGPAKTGLTMAEAEKTLAQLVAEGWYERSHAGFYSLSARALMELRGWLTETYNDPEGEDEEEELMERIKACKACRDIVTVGQRCPKLECNARMHAHCVRNIFRAQGGREECPVCKTAWQEPPPVGEKAARGARRSTNGTNVVNGRRSSADVMEGAEGEEAE